MELHYRSGLNGYTHHFVLIIYGQRLTSRADDLLARLRSAGLAVDLATIAITADREERTTDRTTYEPMIVHVPTPEDVLLAVRWAMSDRPSVCVPTRQGRSRVSPLGLLLFVPPVMAKTTPTASAGELPRELRARFLRIEEASHKSVGGTLSNR